MNRILLLFSAVFSSMFNKLKEILIEKQNNRSSSIDQILYSINQDTLISCPAGKTGEVIISSQAKTINSYAFSECIGITKIKLPASIKYINDMSFGYCINLRSIISESRVPPTTNGSFVFNMINKNTCNLVVPFGSKEKYQSAAQWKSFINIIEMPGFYVSSSSLDLDAKAGSQASVNIYANVDWQYSIDQNWLSVNLIPATIATPATITITATNNPLTIARTAVITLTSNGISPEKITVTQKGQTPVVKTIAISAGGLLTALTSTELNTITDLILSGTIDARDFKTMRDKMPMLSSIDLSQANIVAYTGNQGVTSTSNMSYQANAIPIYSFYNVTNRIAKTSLTTIKLPKTTTTLENSAFYYCTGLESVEFPEGLTTIKNFAFAYCTGLNAITLPLSLISIGDAAFNECTELNSANIPALVISIGFNSFNKTMCFLTVDANNANFSSLEGVLFNKIKTELIYCPSTKADNYAIPESVTKLCNMSFYNCTNLKQVSVPSTLKHIGAQAFQGCSSLSEILIPTSVSEIGAMAFAECTGLNVIKTAITKPIDLSNSSNVFQGVNISKCQLIVPFKSNSAYSMAEQWKDFTNIIEVPGIILSNNQVNIGAYQDCKSSIMINANLSWFAISGQECLTLNPDSGNTNEKITI